MCVSTYSGSEIPEHDFAIIGSWDQVKPRAFVPFTSGNPWCVWSKLKHRGRCSYRLYEESLSKLGIYGYIFWLCVCSFRFLTRLTRIPYSKDWIWTTSSYKRRTFTTNIYRVESFSTELHFHRNKLALGFDGNKLKCTQFSAKTGLLCNAKEWEKAYQVHRFFPCRNIPSPYRMVPWTGINHIMLRPNNWWDTLCVPNKCSLRLSL